MRLQLGGDQHRVHRAGGQAEFSRERPHAPAALIFGLLANTRLHPVPNAGIMLGRPSATRRIPQSLDAVGGK
jgi:hypothetical protein